MVGNVLCEFYDRDGNEEYREVTYHRAVYLGVSSVGADSLDNREFRVIEETLESYGAETFLYGGEIHYSHFHAERAVVDISERGYQYREQQARAYTDDERNEFRHTLAFDRCEYDYNESEQTYEDVPEAVIRSAVGNYNVER